MLHLHKIERKEFDLQEKKKSAFVKTNALKKAPQFFPMLFFKFLLVDHL